MPNKTLLFVYNADSGLFNTVADIAHKITSPDTYACDLCSLTHGYFTINKQWQQFLDSTDDEFVFLHRDEFRKQYPDVATPLPAIFIDTDEGLQALVSKAELGRLEDVQQLIGLIESARGKI